MSNKTDPNRTFMIPLKSFPVMAFFFLKNILQIKRFMVLYLSKYLKGIQERICFTQIFFPPFTKLEIGFSFGITLRMDDEQNEDK